MKKGPLSKKEKAYVAENYKSMTATIMADKIGRSVHMVDKYIMTLDFSVEQEDTMSDASEEDSKPSPEPNPLYARNVADNGVVRSTIGTQAASMAADESRSRRKESNGLSPRYKKQHIHQIKPKD